MAKNVNNKEQWKGNELIVYEDFVLFTAQPKGIRQKMFGFENDEDWRAKSKVRLKRKSCVSPTTVNRWKSHDEFWKDVKKKMHEWAKDLTPTVIGSLLKTIAKNGKASEVKLWMQIFEDFTEKTDTTIKTDAEDESKAVLSKEEKKALVMLRDARRKRIEEDSDKLE